MLNFVENKYVIAIARTALVLIYFMGGFSLLTGSTPVEFAATKGVPAIAVYVGYAIKLFGGLAVIIGFLGVMMIMSPGSDIFTPYSLLPIGAAFGYSLSTVCVRLFDEHNPTALINMYASAGALFGALSIVFATSGYQPVETLHDWGLLVCMGLVGGFAVLALINA